MVDMKEQVLLLKPTIHEKIWGGNKLKDLFGYNYDLKDVGEIWGISAHKDGPSIITNGVHKGLSLSELFDKDRSYFANIENKEFPLLVKLIDANEALSVQVHPDDKMAVRYNDLGKTECWYVLDCKEDTTIVYGHKATTKEEFVKLINAGKYDELLNYKTVKPGDFIYVPAGQIHAINKDTVILEVQQSSNVTFRLYDYDRTDDQGNTRDLHIKETIEATTIPEFVDSSNPKVFTKGNNKITEFIKAHYFSVEKWDIEEQYKRENKTFQLLVVLEGKGNINGYDVKKGDFLIVTSYAKEVEVKGNLELMVSYV